MMMRIPLEGEKEGSEGGLEGDLEEADLAEEWEEDMSCKRKRKKEKKKMKKRKEYQVRTNPSLLHIHKI